MEAVIVGFDVWLIPSLSPLVEVVQSVVYAVGVFPNDGYIGVFNDSPK